MTKLDSLEFLGFDLKVKRDDLYPLSGGGNKARKLDFIIKDALSKGHNAVVTTGSAQSNHVRATALRAAQLGWKSIMVIHDTEPTAYQGNLLLTSLVSDELRFVSRNDVAQEMDRAMDVLRQQGYNPLYIWGGGHCVQGALAYFEAARELSQQLEGGSLDYIVVASGTGATQAGLEVGVREFLPGCTVLGVSVAREREKAIREIRHSAEELQSYLGLTHSLDGIFLDDTKMGKGYGDIFPELLETIREMARKGVILDPTYTGKAFHAMREYLRDGTIPRVSDVLFWHTGGLLNLMASEHFT